MAGMPTAGSSTTGASRIRFGRDSTRCSRAATVRPMSWKSDLDGAKKTILEDEIAESKTSIFVSGLICQQWLAARATWVDVHFLGAVPECTNHNLLPIPASSLSDTRL